MHCQKRSVKDIALVAHAAGADIAEIAAEVADGAAEFFSLDQCHYVTRVEKTTRGKELVVVCAEGRKLRTVRAIVERARQLGFDCIRFHPSTKARGLAMAREAGVAVTWHTEPKAAYYIVNLRGQHG